MKQQYKNAAAILFLLGVGAIAFVAFSTTSWLGALWLGFVFLGLAKAAATLADKD